MLINVKTEHFLKNKSTFCFVLQILFVPLQYRKGDKRLTSSTLPVFTSSLVECLI